MKLNDNLLNVYSFQEKYPSKVDKIRQLVKMSDYEINSLINSCPSIYGKMFYSRYKKTSTRFERIFSDDGTILYEGEVLNGKPYGVGITYWENGNKYQEGIFDIKGLVYGIERYPNGNVRFKGVYEINRGYGPNYPIYGECFNEDGVMIYKGKLEISKSAIGYPFIKEPKEFNKVIQNNIPDIKYYIWSDIDIKKED